MVRLHTFYRLFQMLRFLSWRQQLLFQVGYGVPAVLCGFIGLKPHVTGRETCTGSYELSFYKVHCLIRTSRTKKWIVPSKFTEFPFLFSTLITKLLNSAPLHFFQVLIVPSNGFIMTVQLFFSHFWPHCRDFALEAYCWYACDDVQCCHCHVRVDTL